MATREQVAELEAACDRVAVYRHRSEHTEETLLAWEAAIARLTRARAACIGEQEMPGGESGA